MRMSIAHLKLSSSVAIGVISILSLGVPVRAEPVSGLIVEQSPGESLTPSKLTEAGASPTSDSGDVADEKNKATGAKPAQEPLARDRQSIQPSAGRNERLLNQSGSQIIESSGSLAADARANEDGLLSREFKEAVRPLYEDLAGSAVVETLRGLKSDLGLNSSPSLNGTTSSDYSQNGSNSAPQDSEPWQGPGNRYGHHNRAQPAAQTEKEKLVAAVMLDELIEAVKPWLYGLAGLYIFGYMVKLGLDYFSWKTTRSRKRAARGKRRHRRPQRPTDNRGA
ncbi:MAG: hypothetical protein JNM42_01250 [Propionivibrio sp.]|uniref:hypothetical protein n=1 Tax=Propionivibrio sp. TaxID=2212460 RepID=UPI001A424E54|nr:hypothetical protein [Propionivibrio sp.]MBL8413047.1 hypothetical protein [Propionivibrio sp.]